jgi:selenocysteine lyase/cysteine desulfurase
MALRIGTYNLTRVLYRSSSRTLNYTFKFSLQTYGAQVDQLRADFGGTVDIAQIEQALRSKKYKIVTITHVDTSTGAVLPIVGYVSSTSRLHHSLPLLGVLSDPQPVADAVKRISPETLVVLDAVCAVASEDIQMDNWGIDVVISASQKGLGAPPGLSIVIASQKAMKVKISVLSLVDVLAQQLINFPWLRPLRRVRNRSRRTMRAGRGKSFHSMT